METCLCHALVVKQGLIEELQITIEEHQKFLDRCQEQNKFFRPIDLKYIERESRLNNLINEAERVAQYLGRMKNSLAGDLANVVYEDIEEVEDYDYRRQ